MKAHTLIFFAVGCALMAVTLGCDECGEECRKVCGTKQFKTCCFNYLRKRGMPDESGPDLRLEVSVANSQGRQVLPAYLPFAALAQFPSYQQGRRGPPGAPLEPEQGRLQLVYDA